MLLQLISGFHIKIPTPTIVIPIQMINVPHITKFAKAPANTRVQKILRAAPVVQDSITETVTPITGSTAAVAEQDAEPVVPAVIEPVAPVAQNVPDEKPAATVLIQPPPSARYELDVVRTEVNVANPYYGSGEIIWEHDDKNYKMSLEVGVVLLFARIRLYTMQSEGTLGDAGIKPETMTEARRGRTTTVTHFNYDNDTISFSASSNTVPMSEGAQDRATVLMQLASIGNADAAQFQRGKEITIQVAEDKEANPFLFVVLNQETIETKLGRISAWHIVRPPRPGSYTSQLDIWVAPELNWLPVQIRNTEVNGAITTQTIRKIITGSK